MNKVLIANDEHNAILVLSDGKYFLGSGIGRTGITSGEICFNTSMTGYQEILTDPSYAEQIITFTFPHIGNVGCNAADMECDTIFCKGLIISEKITQASNYRATMAFNDWLLKYNMCGICNIDTRELTRYIRQHGAEGALIYHAVHGEKIDIGELQQKATSVSGLDGVDLSVLVSTDTSYEYCLPKAAFQYHNPHNMGFNRTKSRDSSINGGVTRLRVVVIDYGTKQSMLDCLSKRGCDITVVSAQACFEDIRVLNPDGVFLSNGPGDPYATYSLIKDVLQQIINSGIPVFGVCLGHQLLAIVFNLKTIKMHQGHRGSNHPVKNLRTGRVEITSQNHGFCVEVDANHHHENIEITHISLFDRTIEGIEVLDRPIFSVQYHPEASPGPMDSDYLFDKFVANMQAYKEKI